MSSTFRLGNFRTFQFRIISWVTESLKKLSERLHFLTLYRPGANQWSDPSQFGMGRHKEMILRPLNKTSEFLPFSGLTAIGHHYPDRIDHHCPKWTQNRLTFFLPSFAYGTKYFSRPYIQTRLLEFFVPLIAPNLNFRISPGRSAFWSMALKHKKKDLFIGTDMADVQSHQKHTEQDIGNRNSSFYSFKSSFRTATSHSLHVPKYQFGTYQYNRNLNLRMKSIWPKDEHIHRPLHRHLLRENWPIPLSPNNPRQLLIIFHRGNHLSRDLEIYLSLSSPKIEWRRLCCIERISSLTLYFILRHLEPSAGDGWTSGIRRPSRPATVLSKFRFWYKNPSVTRCLKHIQLFTRRVSSTQ